MKQRNKENTVSPVPSLDLYTYTDEELPSYSYGDEASLYSIAEDSREDAASRTTGGCTEQTSDLVLVARVDDPISSSSRTTGGYTEQTSDLVLIASVDDPISSNSNSSGNKHIGEEELGVEMSLENDDEDDDSAAIIYDYDRRQRRRRHWAAAFLICLVLALIAISVTVTQVQEDTSRSTVSKGIETEAEPDTTVLQAETLVAIAISDCPSNSIRPFTVENTPQSDVFRMIVEEVVSQATVDPTTGNVLFDDKHGIDYLKEKYALGLLYYATEGQSWNNNKQWMSMTDPCDGWTGVVCNKPRIQGTCAISSLELGKSLRAFVCVWRGSSRRKFFSLTTCFAFSTIRFQWLGWVPPRRILLYSMYRTHWNGKQQHWWKHFDLSSRAYRSPNC